jgi:polyisoprenyl-phosphate glycosyltransferase
MGRWRRFSSRATNVGRPAGLPAAEPPALELTAVVPCYNEADSVDLAYQRITRELERYGDIELLFVDDGSTDATLERIKELAAADRRVKYLSFSRNFGQEAAFSAGFKYASRPWTVQFDADLQWPPEEVHKLLARTADGFDVVFGIRERRQDPPFRRFGAWATQWLAGSWLGIELPRGASAFRVVRSSVAKKIVALRLDTPYFIATVPRVGARYTTVPIRHRPRVHGSSKWSVRKLAVHGLELLFGFSLRPLVLVYLFSLIAVLGGLALAGLALAGRLDNMALGFATLAVEVLSLVALAVVARYVVRLLRGQGGRRAQFYIREANIPVQPEDDLYGHERAAEAPIAHRGLAS